MKRKVVFLFTVCVLLILCVYAYRNFNILTLENKQLIAENEELREQLTELQVKITATQNSIDGWYREIEELREQLTELQVKITTPKNPIDGWYREIYGPHVNSHTIGFVGFVYGNAWKAELKHLVEKIDSVEADAYYDAVSQEYYAIISLVQAQEIDSGWSTGSSGRISLAGADVYRNGVYQLNPFYSDFIFDKEAATQELIQGGLSISLS